MDSRDDIGSRRRREDGAEVRPRDPSPLPPNRAPSIPPCSGRPPCRPIRPQVGRSRERFAAPSGAKTRCMSRVRRPGRSPAATRDVEARVAADLLVGRSSDRGGPRLPGFVAAGVPAGRIPAICRCPCRPHAGVRVGRMPGRRGPPRTSASSLRRHAHSVATRPPARSHCSRTISPSARGSPGAEKRGPRSIAAARPCPRGARDGAPSLPPSSSFDASLRGRPTAQTQSRTAAQQHIPGRRDLVSRDALMRATRSQASTRVVAGGRTAPDRLLPST